MNTSTIGRTDGFSWKTRISRDTLGEPRKRVDLTLGSSGRLIRMSQGCLTASHFAHPSWVVPFVSESDGLDNNR